jgi:hypothetical protein
MTMFEEPLDAMGAREGDESGPVTAAQLRSWWVQLAFGGVDRELKEILDERMPGWIEAGAPLRKEFVGPHNLPPKPWPEVAEMITCPTVQDYYKQFLATGKAPANRTCLYYALSAPVVQALGLDLAPASFRPRYQQSHNRELMMALKNRMRQQPEDELAARAYVGKVWEAGAVLFAEEQHTVIDTGSEDRDA